MLTGYSAAQSFAALGLALLAPIRVMEAAPGATLAIDGEVDPEAIAARMRRYEPTSVLHRGSWDVIRGSGRQPTIDQRARDVLAAVTADDIARALTAELEPLDWTAPGVSLRLELGHPGDRPYALSATAPGDRPRLGSIGTNALAAYALYHLPSRGHYRRQRAETGSWRWYLLRAVPLRPATGAEWLSHMSRRRHMRPPPPGWAVYVHQRVSRGMMVSIEPPIRVTARAPQWPFLSDLREVAA